MATNTIFIYGASGHGKVVADIIHACGFTLGGWIDDDPSKGYLSWETFCTLNSNAKVALGIGSNRIRSHIAHKIRSAGHALPILIHPSAVVSPSAIFQEGTVVMPLCIINADATIGAGTIINSGSIIEHDCRIGNYAHLSAHSSLAGNVTIGDYTHIGISASVIQRVSIGQESIIGAGATVISNLPDCITAVGIPAKIIKGIP